MKNDRNFSKMVENTVEKGEILIMSNFSFSHRVLLGRGLLQARLHPDLNTIPNNCVREFSLAQCLWHWFFYAPVSKDLGGKLFYRCPSVCLRKLNVKT